MIYEKIKTLCQEKGISISECERLAGVGNGVIAGWKVSIPRLDKIEAVAKVLGVSVNYFVKGET